MAVTFYPLGKKNILDGEIDLLTDNIKLLLVTSGYTYDATDEFHADISGATIVATSANLGSKTVTLSGTKQVFDAADVTFSAVNNGTFTAMILYRDSGVSATSQLIGHFTTASTATNGGDITITFSSGTDKIFSLD